jgi:hypothetical protein
MVDKQRLSGCGRCHGQAFTVGQHVDEAGLANVGTANEGVLRHVMLRALAHVGVADYEFGALNIHLQKCFMVQK